MKKSPLPPLTQKERLVLEFIEAELLKKGVSPSYQEICDHFGFASYNSVQNYLKQLSNKGYVSVPQSQKRAINILFSAKDFQKGLAERLSTKTTPTYEDNSEHSIPFLGRVAAGSPIERITSNEFLAIPKDIVKVPGNYFALQVEGDSMIEEGILDGDFLVVLSQVHAKDGDLVVATVDNEATVKRFYIKKNPNISATQKMVELRPSNSLLKSMWYAPEQIELKGLVKGLIRKYN